MTAAASTLAQMPFHHPHLKLLCVLILSRLGAYSCFSLSVGPSRSPQHHAEKHGAETVPTTETRRSFVTSGAATAAAVATASPFLPPGAPPAAAASSPPGVVDPSRGVIDLGGGFDLFGGKPPRAADVLYPPSVIGPWVCQRVVVQVEGDAGQAELAWRALDGGGGGSNGGDLKRAETYATRFVEPGVRGKTYEYQGETVTGVVLDRGFEAESRTRGGPGSVTWNVQSPDTITIIREDGGPATELAVVQRTTEAPTDKGFGSNELFRITTSAGGLFGDSKVVRAARVQRRWRRAFDDSGNRIVEGLEIVKTYRVLDGVAGVEMPTSTTKSQMRLTRPPPQMPESRQ